MHSISNLRMAIQKSGRLGEKCRDLLEKCGITFEGQKNQLFSRSMDYPLDLMLLRDDDIPALVRDQVCDLGIVGYNELKEKVLDKDGAENVEILMNLGFGRCRLSLAVPEDTNFENLESLRGKKIATSYPVILDKYMSAKGINCDIVEISGSVEVSYAIGFADAICDLVSTGATLQSNGLKEVLPILESEAVLVRNARKLSDEKEELITRLMDRIDGVLKAKRARYVMMNAPRASVDDIIQIIPGMENPTIMPLGQDGDKVAIHAVAPDNVFWDTMEKLKQAGASSILVVPIEKIIE